MMRALLIICTLFMSSLAFAQMAESSETLELRAREVGRALRCVVCQNQSIEDSDAALAKDMRLLVRERLAQGDSDADIMTYMRERYGDFVLLKPPVQRNTYMLWGLPAFILLIMGAWLWRVSRRSPTDAPLEPSGSIELSDEEKMRLKQILDDPS